MIITAAHRHTAMASALVALAIGMASPRCIGAKRALSDARAVPHLGQSGRQDYEEFLRSETHRAFVVAPGGAWSWIAAASSPAAALASARDACEERTEQRCVPYAVDHRVVFDEAAWPTLWGSLETETGTARARPGTRRGDHFPDLALIDPAGKPTHLSDLRDKVVVLHFWGTWCPECVHELPQLEKLRAALGSRSKVAFVLAQVREPITDTRRWLERHRLSLPQYDSGARADSTDLLRLGDGRQITDRQLAPGFPTTYVLDRRGRVLFSLRGAAPDWSQYAPFLRYAADHP